MNNNNSYLQSLTSSIEEVTSPYRDYLTDLHEKYHPITEGFISDYIPELGLANPAWFGICIATVDGQVFEVGNCQKMFTIQSISRAFIYGLALEDWGRDRVNRYVSVEPTAEGLNSIILDKKSNRPNNPMVDAGAIVTTDLIKGNGATERLRRILDMFRRYTGRELNISMPVCLSQKAAGHRERAIAHLMLKFGTIQNKIEETLDLYFQHCSIMLNSRDLAIMAATLANGGINPITGEKAIDSQYLQDVISVILTCGMYDYSGEWTYKVGIPTKSSVSGGLTAIVPQKLGIGVFSPLVDERGNSVRGMKVCEDISQKFSLHLFNIYEKNQEMLKYIEEVDKITAAAAALENDTFQQQSLDEVITRTDELGQLARVFLQMVQQVKVREQKLKQQVQELQIEIDKTKQAQKVAEIVESDSFQNLKQKLQRMKKVRAEKEKK